MYRRIHIAVVAEDRTVAVVPRIVQQPSGFGSIGCVGCGRRRRRWLREW